MIPMSTASPHKPDAVSKRGSLPCGDPALHQSVADRELPSGVCYKAEHPESYSNL